MMIGVFRGAQPNACFDVGIERLTLINGKLVVLYIARLPDAGLACAAVISNPAHPVVVGRKDVPVPFDAVVHGPE